RTSRSSWPGRSAPRARLGGRPRGARPRPPRRTPPSARAAAARWGRRAARRGCRSRPARRRAARRWTSAGRAGPPGGARRARGDARWARRSPWPPGAPCLLPRRPPPRGGSCRRSGRCAPRWSRAPRAWGRARAGSGPRVAWRSSPLPMLGAPVEADARIVVGDALLVGGVVALGGVVEERGGLAAEHAVAVRHAGRDGDHQGAALAGVEHVGPAARGRALAQVVEDHLRAPRREAPHVPLAAVAVEGLDHARVGDGEGRLLDGAEDRLVVAHHLHQEAAV